MPCIPMRAAVLGDEQPTPSAAAQPPPGGGVQVPHKPCCRSQKLWKTQLWPICSIRVLPSTVLKRTMLPTPTWCWLVVNTVDNCTSPVLHLVVPTEYAAM